MRILISLSPLFLFVFLFVGSGIYFSFQGIDQAFYQLSPTVAILPALVWAFLLEKGSTQRRITLFLDGARHQDIMSMCIIFLLAGAFTSITKAVGSADATVNFALSILSPQYLLIGIFITAAFISTAIGTSMGTIATLTPLALGLAHQQAFPLDLGMATVVGGAMFGDNLSIISDTTLAAVISQEADLKEKIKINAIIAGIAAFFTIILLFFIHEHQGVLQPNHYSFLLILPYLFLISLAFMGINVFIALILSIVFTGVIGIFYHGHSIFFLSQEIARGFGSMYEIMTLSILIGGLSGLTQQGSQAIAIYLAQIIPEKSSKKTVQLIIAKIVSIFDLLLANNTIAIIFSGKIVKQLAQRYGIPAHYSATWLDIFSCVFQGIIPYGAQILLVSALSGLSPLTIMTKVYYCYILGIVSILFILLNPKLKS